MSEDSPATTANPFNPSDVSLRLAHLVPQLPTNEAFFLQRLEFDLMDQADQELAFQVSPCGDFARIFLNNGQDPTLPTNNTLFGEISLPTSVREMYSYPLMFGMPPNFRILVVMRTGLPAGSHGWQIRAVRSLI